MIKIQHTPDDRAAHRTCTSCQKEDSDMREIVIIYDGMGNFGTQIALCKKCRKTLLGLLENEKAKREAKPEEDDE